MVDTVLYFEGDRGHPYRILRAVKNRFGATDEIGVFEMVGSGLREVPNPSELFLGERNSKSPGLAVFAGMEGTRPILVEMQALVAPSGLGTPRRAVVGWDANRLSMLLAVLDARCGVSFSQPRRLSQRRRRTEDHRAGRRSRRRRRPAFVVFRRCSSVRQRLLRRNLAVRRGAARKPHGGTAQGSAEARVCQSRDTVERRSREQMLQNSSSTGCRT